MKLHTIAISLMLAFTALQSQAVGRLADVTVLDRDTGATLPVYYSRGEYWVAGRPGAKYALQVRNRMAGRLLAVASIDGINVISGETAAWGQTGYVFAPFSGYQITGWRKSNASVAAFEFSDSSESYAERTSRPNQVGVIGVALFQEQQPEPVAQAPAYFGGHEANGELRRSPQKSSLASGASDAAAESAAASTKAPTAAQRSDSSAANKSAQFAPAPLPTPKLGTAHGQREDSVVTHTSFVRQQTQPNEIIRIRYDSRENLLASGVIHEPMRPRMLPNPFPESDLSYVPDPPARRQ